MSGHLGTTFGTRAHALRRCCVPLRRCSDTVLPTREPVLRYILSSHYPWHCTTRAVLRTHRVPARVLSGIPPQGGRIRDICCAAAPQHRYTHAVWHARYVRWYRIRQSCRYTWYSTVPLVCSGTMLSYTTCAVQRYSPPLSSSTTYYLLCTHHPLLEPSCDVVLQRVAHIGLPVPAPAPYSLPVGGIPHTHGTAIVQSDCTLRCAASMCVCHYHLTGGAASSLPLRGPPRYHALPHVLRHISAVLLIPVLRTVALRAVVRYIPTIPWY